MGFSPRQVRYGFNMTKEIDSKTFGVKGFITQLVLLAVARALASRPPPRALDQDLLTVPKGVEVVA